MFGFKAPFKFMVVKSCAGARPVNAREIHAQLRGEYGNEKQCSLETIEYHLQALKAVGIVKIAGASIEDNETMDITYIITRSGKDMLDKLSL